MMVSCMWKIALTFDDDVVKRQKESTCELQNYHMERSLTLSKKGTSMTRDDVLIEEEDISLFSPLQKLAEYPDGCRIQLSQPIWVKLT